MLMLIPLVLLAAYYLGRSGSAGQWSRFIESQRLQLLSGSRVKLRRWPVTFALAAILAVLALAAPTWEKLPVPTRDDKAPLVVLFDLSPSMLAQDLAPDRLTRARLKVTDLLRQRSEGQTALIAYAGSPHRVSPLTDDTRTIENLLPALHPAVMPQGGSNVEGAVELALEMLASAGFESRGQLLLVTDGVSADAQKAIRDLLPVGVRLSILGVGTPPGAPVPTGSGGFLRDSRSEIIVARLNRNELQMLAGAAGGRYIELQADDADIHYLLEPLELQQVASEEVSETTYDDWHDAGYWLVILMLPLALLAARRGVLFALLPLALLSTLPAQRAEAGLWDDLWLTADQQGKQALADGDAARAAELFEDPEWRGYAAWQAGDYRAAADSFSEAEQASLYNQGTTLAGSGDLEGALAKLNSFIQANPDHENARFNRDLIEQLLQQQEQEQQSGESGDSDQDQSAGESQSEDGSSGDEGQSGQQQSAGGDSQENDGESSSQPDANTEGTEQSGENSADAGGAEENGEETSAEQQQEAMTAAANEGDEPSGEQTMGLADGDNLSAASEQWLRAIPDDPAGLLRRKFEYEQQLYRQQQRFLPPNRTSTEERY